MGSVFYRDPGHDYPVAVRGEGVYLYDANGKEYLDGSGGAAITCLGCCHAKVSKAIGEQVGKRAFAHTVALTNESSAIPGAARPTTGKAHMCYWRLFFCAHS